MPRIRPTERRLDPVVDVLNAAHAHRLAVGWLTAREAGINPPLDTLVGGQFLDRWQNTRNLPRMIKAYQPQARLMYRIRLLCLGLNHHPFAPACGGPEQWWQRILEEDVLAAITDRLAPQLFPGITPPTRAASTWWMRKGVNVANPNSKPATWALIEATQAGVYPSRGECRRPADDTPLPLAALNGQWGVPKRKQLLRDITGSENGWRMNDRIELCADWLKMLEVWQSSAKESSTKIPPARFTDVERYEACAVLIHDLVMPSWWAEISRIGAALNQIPRNKPSVCNGSDAIGKIQQTQTGDSSDSYFDATDLS